MPTVWFWPRRRTLGLFHSNVTLMPTHRLKPSRNPSQVGSIVGSMKPSASRPLKPRCDESPHKQDYYCANDCTDEPSALAGFVPPDRLAKVGCNKSSNNPEHGRQDEPCGLILVSWI